MQTTTGGTGADDGESLPSLYRCKQHGRTAAKMASKAPTRALKGPKEDASGALAPKRGRFG